MPYVTTQDSPIARLMRQRNMHYQEVAFKVGASESLVRKWCARQRTVTPRFAHRLADIFGVTVAEVLG